MIVTYMPAETNMPHSRSPAKTILGTLTSSGHIFICNDFSEFNKESDYIESITILHELIHRLKNHHIKIANIRGTSTIPAFEIEVWNLIKNIIGIKETKRVMKLIGIDNKITDKIGE